VRLLRVDIDGFCSWSTPWHLDFEPLDLVAIVGRNGAGKSNLLDAILWALYGITRVGGQSDEIIPRTGTAQVRLEFEHLGECWAITRTRARNRTRVRSGVLLQRIIDDKWETINDGRASDGQDLLGQVLGVSSSTWLASVWTGQGDASRFCAAASTDRRQILIDMVADHWSKIHQEVNDQLTPLRRELDQDQVRVDSLRNQIGDPQAIQQQLHDTLGRLDTLRLQIEQAQELVNSMRPQQAIQGQHKARQQLQAQIQRFEQQLEQQAQIRIKLQTAQDELEIYTPAAQHALEALEIIQSEAAVEIKAEQRLEAWLAATNNESPQFDADEGQLTCPTCLQAVSAQQAELVAHRHMVQRQQLEQQLEQQRDEVRLVQEAVIEAKQAYNTAQAAVQQAERQVLQLQAQTRQPQADQQALDEARQALAQMGELIPVTPGDSLPNAERQLQQLQLQQQQAQTELGRLQQRLEDSQAARLQMEKLMEDLQPRQQRREALEKLYTATSRNEIPAAQVASHLDTLQDLINHWAGVISQGRLQVQLITSKRGQRQALEVMVTGPQGTRVWAWCSGGEKRQVDLACRIGISQLHQQMTGTNIRTLVIDEGWDALDQEATTTLTRALWALRDHFDLILTITHLPEVADAFPWRLEVRQGAAGSEATLLAQGA